MGIRIITNNQPRPIVDPWELTPTEREKFDYLDWQAIENGTDSATFLRYKGELYSLSEFSTDWGITKGGGLPECFKGWDGYLSDSFWSGLLVKFDPDYPEYVIVARFVTD
jgi:hypothetical protein